MLNRDFQLNQEPLWSVSRPPGEVALSSPDNNEYTSFLCSALYCGINLFFLLLFGLYALNIGNTGRGIMLFTLAATTVFGYGAIWLAGWHIVARYFTTMLMFILCLYLFYDGGVQNTGPLYYFVFPSAALFLHGRLRGFIWVLSLLLLTIFLNTGIFGFEVDKYDNVFVSRTVAICLLITLLSCIPEYFRSRAELNVLLSYSDIESTSYGDSSTGLANRNLLEKILRMEFNRNARYNSSCCLMFIEADPVTHIIPGIKTGVDKQHVLTIMADVFRKYLRVQDIAGRWEKNCFLLVLPEINIEGARELAQRLLDSIKKQGLLFGHSEAVITASIGVTALDKSPAQEVLNRAASNLLAAQKSGGNNFVAV